MLTSLYKSKISYGLEFIIQENDKICLRLTGLKNVKGKLEVLITDKELDSINELKKIVKPYQNLNLSFTGKGLLVKCIEVNGEKSNENLLKKVIPGANTQDYYYQAYYSSASQTIVTIIRRQFIDKCLNELYQAGYFINHVVLGPFSASSLYPYIKQFNQHLEHEWQIEGYSLIFKNGKLCMVSKSNGNKMGHKAMFTGSEQIHPSYILSYASAAFYFLNEVALTDDDYEGIRTSRQNFKQKTMQSLLIKVFIIVILALAVVNAIVYTYQYNQHNALKERSFRENKKYANYESLKQEFDIKVSLAKDLDLFREYHKGLILDQLAISRPKEIQWTKVEFDPVDEELLKSKRKQEFIEKTIDLEGTCQNPILFNNWLNDLEKLPWVRDIKDQSFKYNENKKTGMLKFRIQLN